MDDKTLTTLEYFKILEKLAEFTAFSGSAEKARNLRPTSDIEEARTSLAETREAVQLLSTRPELTIGGVRDVRAAVDLAARGSVLTTAELLDIKSTLVASRTLARLFERLSDQFPNLFGIVVQLPPPLGLVDSITRTISERGEILDSASLKLGVLRRDINIAHGRLMAKLQRMVSDPSNIPYLQEPIITQRDGRYVLPLRAEFKGRIKAIVHDQSSSGATLFIEPLGVVELNNHYRELQLAERDEERRILIELSNQVGDLAEEILQTVELISLLDLALAKAKYAERLEASEPALFPMKPSRDGRHPGSIIRLYHARHPLLDQNTVVPIDVELDPQTFALVITGPNTGGKTVSLKTVGLLVLMAQSGLHIPVKSGSEFSVFKEVFADIGDEQSIEQSLSTFSGHITNIIRILEKSDRRSLVILDELGAGTDPQEGAALARALLTHLLERRITTLVTTHHPELKAFAHATPGVVNASVEFDLETLQPTYHLTIGLPGRSNALAIAERLGLPKSIINYARSEISPEDVRAEDLLNEIHRQRDLSRQARESAEKARREAEALEAGLSQRLESVEDERRAILEKARLEAENQLQDFQEEVRQLRGALARARQPLEALKTIQEQVDDIEERLEKPIERQSDVELPFSRDLRIGDKVHVKTLNVQGVITSLGEEEAEVQVGMLRVRARISELQYGRPSPVLNKSGTVKPDKAAKAQETRESPASTSAKQSAMYSPSPGMELDLRGRRAEDALDELGRYLDASYLAGLPYVRIIHGKGTGKLRQAVREALADHPQVKSFQAGGDKEGGDGVTIAQISSS
jgi:DNA mismatch repair protein MutS2